MFKLIWPAAPLGAAIFAASSSHAAEPTWYVQGNVGATVESEFEADNNAVNFDDGMLVSGAGGYSFGNGLRVEGELLYMQNDIEGGSDGEAKTLAIFANVAYDFNREGRIQPFVGAGLGLARIDYDDGIIDGDDVGLAYQAKGGVAYRFNDRLTGEIAYRYMGVTDVEFGSGASALDGDLDSQAITIGLRYKLGS